MKRLLYLALFLITFSATVSAINFSGIYYCGPAGSKPGGGDPQFLSFKSVCDSLNTGTFSGNTVVYITGDLTEAVTPGLACNPGTFTLTIKPYTGLNPTVTFLYPADANSGPSGAFIIGITAANNIAWTDIVPTRNIIFDGSNIDGGTTRNLTFTTTTTSHRNAITMLFVGDVSNCVLKNCNVYYKSVGVSTSGSLFLAPVMIRARNSGTDFVPSNITIQNNLIRSNFDGVFQNAQGIGCYQSGTATATNPTNIFIKGNAIEAKCRGIGLYKTGSWQISGNYFKVNQDAANDLLAEAVLAIDVAAGSTTEISGNFISQIYSKDSITATNGAAGIRIESNGTYNVFNNFIFGLGLNTTMPNPSGYLYGIKVSSATATANIYYNTIQMDSLGYTLGTGNLAVRGLFISDGINTVKNNIIKTTSVNFASYCFYRSGTTGTVVSNNNNFYAPGDSAMVGFFNTANTPLLADWKLASSQDSLSFEANPGLKSNTDLHLSAVSSPAYGKAVVISSITTDIDGQQRKVTPDCGADELPGNIPVELVAFNASLNGNTVTLTWKTATESNNRGFELQKFESGSWLPVSFIEGSGNSTEMRTYTATDIVKAGVSASYRLKQIDFNGSFTYSGAVNVSNTLPTDFTLEQNFPNPFNPSTVIKFTLPEKGLVTLRIYDVTGKEIATPVNEVRDAGTYNVKFNAHGLASGVYYYSLNSSGKTITKKMLLNK